MLRGYAAYLELAGGAMSHGNYFSALQYGLRAAGAPKGHDQTRCDAYLLLALISLEMGLPEEALTYAVGAQLYACRTCDTIREERAGATIGILLASYPQLREEAANECLH